MCGPSPSKMGNTVAAYCMYGDYWTNEGIFFLGLGSTSASLKD